MPKTAQQITDKQVRRAQEAADDYLQGAEGVTEAPGVKAVRKKDKLRANFNAAVDSGKWEENTKAVSNDEWKRSVREKGAPRYASGVEAARPDILAFHEEFQAFLNNVKKEIDAMPDTTPEQRIAKMVANARAISKFKRTRRRR